MTQTGRVAIVTGAGLGIGQAIAGKLAGQGAKIVLNDLDPVLAEQAAARIRENGQLCLPRGCAFLTFQERRSHHGPNARHRRRLDLHQPGSLSLPAVSAHHGENLSLCHIGSESPGNTAETSIASTAVGIAK